MNSFLKASVLALFTGTALPSFADELTIVSWNIANLHHETGVALRDRAVARQDIDYSRLSEIALGLNADIVALQEIGSPSALARIFPASDYHLLLSDRYQAGDENRPPEERDIYTALAVSKAQFPQLPNIATIDAFSIQHIDLNRDGTRAEIRPTRSAMHVAFEHNGQTISLLNVHLKSSCHQFSLDEIEDQNFFNGNAFGSRFDCRTLSAQLAILENWIEVENALGHQVIIAGDFNRRLNMVYRNPTRHEDFWASLNDGQPEGLLLTKGPLGLDAVCWPQHENRFDEHIDFVIADSDFLSGFSSVTFAKTGLGHDTDQEYAEGQRQRLSDHCPVSMTLTD